MLDLSWRLEPAYRPAGRPRSPSRAARLPEHPKPPIRLEQRPVFHRLPAALQATSDGTCVAFSQRDGAQKPDETATCQCCLDRSDWTWCTLQAPMPRGDTPRLVSAGKR